MPSFRQRKKLGIYTEGEQPQMGWSLLYLQVLLRNVRAGSRFPYVRKMIGCVFR